MSIVGLTISVGITNTDFPLRIKLSFLELFIIIFVQMWIQQAS